MDERNKLKNYCLTISHSFLGKSVRPKYSTDRRGRTLLRFSTGDRNDFGKQIKCSAFNNLGNAIQYAKIPGD